jgi:hypothetical protein
MSLSHPACLKHALVDLGSFIICVTSLRSCTHRSNALCPNFASIKVGSKKVQLVIGTNSSNLLKTLGFFLPVETQLPVHINGSFAVTPDRRQLACKTTDDKNSFESMWNEALMGDAVCNAYILMLENLVIT